MASPTVFSSGKTDGLPASTLTLFPDQTLGDGLLLFIGLANAGSYATTTSFTRNATYLSAPTLRGRVEYQTGAGLYITVEEWYCEVLKTTNEGESLVANFSGSVTNCCFTCVDVTGLSSNAAAFDPNGSLPANSTGATQAEPVTFSTTQADDLILAFVFQVSSSSPDLSTPAGWTSVITGDSFGGFQWGVYSQSVSSAQSGATFTGEGATNGEFVTLVDAVTADAPAIDVDITGASSAASATAPTFTGGITAPQASSAGAPQATVVEIDKTLTGASSAAAVHALSIVSGSQITLTGVPAQGHAGALTPELSIDAPGVHATGAAHEVGGFNVAIVGVSSAAEAGVVLRGVPLVGVFSQTEAGHVRTAERAVLPVYSIMSNAPVAAIGPMSNATVAVIGRLLPSGPQPKSTQVFLQGVSTQSAFLGLQFNRNVSVKVTGVSSTSSATNVGST